ncbi:CAP domain-containing protein [bacterium]|nr:MAG: CAP domain-containing protein [bacterium]
MKFNLKKYFIPHEGNNFKPHSLRTGSVIFILTLVLIIEAGFLLQSLYVQKTGLFASILQNVLVSETNGSRQVEDIPSLKENGLLDTAAKMKAEDMASKSYFAHTSPDGIDPWYWISKAGYKYSYAGENLAINFSDSIDVIKAWLNSPAHRENMLSQHFTEIGIGIAKGTYENKETIFIVQMFGKPVQPPIVASNGGPTAVENIATSAISNSNNQPVVLGETSPASLLTQKAITSPKTVSNYLYAVLMMIVSIALLLNVVIEARIQHPRLIISGVALLVILNAALILNHYLAFANAAIF